MADRILTWSFSRFPEGGVLLPAYYLDGDYVPVAVRIHAGIPAVASDASFDIMVNGVSIFESRNESGDVTNINYQIQHVPDTTIILSAGDTNDEMADSFKNSLVLDSGGWVTCKVVNDSGARNVSINLELEKLTESDEESE